ncbi:MAG TPA: hypothetical protein EYH49_04575 [Aquifex aeolicus]|nr:hypothetical protein [Aquifex aeolicus]
MADPRKAGTDRGDIGAELRHYLISARIRREEYLNLIEELERDELEFDLVEYRDTLKREIRPLREKAVSIGVDNLIELAQEVEKIYEEIISMIEDRLTRL